MGIPGTKWILAGFLHLASAAGPAEEFAKLIEGAGPEEVSAAVESHRDAAALWFRSEWLAFVRGRAAPAPGKEAAPPGDLAAVARAFAERLGEKHHAARLEVARGWSLEDASRALQAQGLWEEGEAAARRGNAAAARKAWAQAKAAASSLGDFSEAGRALLASSALAARSGDATQARSMAREALEAFRKMDDRPGQAAAQAALATALGKGDPAGRAEAFRAAARLYDSIKDRRRAGLTLGSLGSALADLGADRAETGDLREALEAFREAEGIAEKSGDPASRSRAAINLGSLALLQGNAAEAIRACRSALAAEAERKDGGDRLRGATIHYNIGCAEREREEHQAALASYGEALKMLEGSSDSGAKRLKAKVLLRMAATFRLEGNPGEAEKLHAEALELSASIDDPGIRAHLHNLRGMLLDDQGRHGEAVKEYRSSLDLRSAGGDRLGRATALSNLGEALLDLGKTAEALAALREAMEIFEHERLLATSREESEFFLRGRSGPCENLVRGLLAARAEAPGDAERQSLLEEAFATAERARARALADLLREADAEVRDKGPPDLARRERETLGRVSRLQAKLRREAAADPTILPGAPAKASDLEAIRKELDGEEDALRKIKEAIWKERPVHGALHGARPVSISRLGESLPPRSVFLLYLLGEDASFLFAVRSRDARACPLPPREAIRKSAAPFIAMLRTPSKAIEEVTAAGRDLYSLLLLPAEDVLQGCDRIIICPDGILHGLPFEALVRDPGGTASAERPPRYIIEDFAVHYAPSATVLAELCRRPEPGGPPSLLAFSDPKAGRGAPGELRGDALDSSELRELLSGDLPPLRSAAAEVSAVASLFPSGRRAVFAGEEAREKRLKDPEILSRAEVLHVAAHGAISERWSAASALVLAPEPDGSEDGLLQVREVFALPRVPDLVVLPACRTALGELAGGEGMMGFARAFLAAGAGNVVVSLWSVHDAASLALIPAFYRALLKDGRPPDEALRRAKIWYLAEGYKGVAAAEKAEERGGLETVRTAKVDARHPFFWAPCVLIGRGAGRPSAPDGKGR